MRGHRRWSAVWTIAIVLGGGAARGEADAPPDRLAGELWAAPTAVVAQVGSRTVRGALGVGVEDSGAPPDESVAAFRLAVAAVPVPGLELAVISTVITIKNPDRGPFDLGVNGRWSLVRAGKLHFAALGNVHFGGVYSEEYANRRDLGGGLGLATTFCTTADCRGLVSVAGTLDGHDITSKNDSISDGFRKVRGGVNLGITQPLTSSFGAFATGGAQFGLACSVAYTTTTSGCPEDNTVLAATVGGRLGEGAGAFGPSRLVLDLGVSLMHVASANGILARTATLGGGMLSIAWGGY